MGKSTISMAIFHSYVSLLEGMGWSPQDGINMGLTHKRWDQYGLISARKGDTELLKGC